MQDLAGMLKDKSYTKGKVVFGEEEEIYDSIRCPRGFGKKMQDANDALQKRYFCLWWELSTM